MEKELTVAFVGNPNCGKTTLFNAFTGANLKVANWPGVTAVSYTHLDVYKRQVTNCYNTCFVLRDEKGYFMVDAGGGNTVLHQLERAGIDWQDIHTMFVTHKHIDHLLGVIWMMRRICQGMNQGKYKGEAVIYAHEEVIGLLRSMADALLQKKQAACIDDRLHLRCV